MPELELNPPKSLKPSPTRKWYHFRWRILLLVLFIVLVPLAYLGWKQRLQKQVRAELTSLGAIVRTEPLPIPLFSLIAGEDYSEQIIEVYWIGSEIAAEDLSVLSQAGTLRKVEFTNSRLESEGLRHLIGLPRLQTLHLAGTNIGDRALDHVSQIEELEVLSLNKTNITDKGLSKLTNLSQLERLFLNKTSLTDKGMIPLSKMRQLKELSLKDLPITDAGLAKLKTLVNLEILGLDNNPNLTREGILSLRETIPKLVFSLDEQSETNPAKQTKSKHVSKTDNPNTP